MSFLNTRGFAAALFVAAAIPLSATDFFVTSLADSGPGSFRAALDEANVFSPSNYPNIYFSVSGVIRLESPLYMKRSMFIDGGGRITLSGQNKTQVLSAPCCYTGYMQIQNLTIANGWSYYGAGISHSEYSPLDLKNVTFQDNSATESGGAIYNPIDADVYLDSCTFVGNSAPQGGAIFTHMNSDLVILNSTFSGNHATQGGAIYERSASRVPISFSTFSNNSANEGGVLYQWYYTPPTYMGLRFKNTITANNTGGSCVCLTAGQCYVNAGGNLTYPDNTCPGFVADPKLGPLAENGGLTKTVALLLGSPAIDAAAGCLDATSTSVATDQRGLSRPQGLRCDIGAYERSPILFNGFYSPILNLPLINDVNAGRAIPIQFSAGGYLGMNIVAAGYPKSQAVSCETALPTGTAAPIDTPGRSGLTYDDFSRTYAIVWKTEKNWEGACRQLILRLTDGSDHVARFRFR